MRVGAKQGLRKQGQLNCVPGMPVTRLLTKRNISVAGREISVRPRQAHRWERVLPTAARVGQALGKSLLTVGMRGEVPRHGIWVGR